ncbi:WhiB family transcriptional regulator [Pseudolysinimonas kribbensis]|uniref:WhiB family transcriptional regulator n=1 Tax=Pseudolysinimonas kribbensis TaxID=433641 RepID=UPI003CD08A9A
MDDLQPLCINDQRFIDDDTRPDTVRGLCAQCPLNSSCAEYARTARPRGGIWAGRRWGRS